MPSTFLTPLEIEYIDGRSWKITSEFDYALVWGEPETIKVPAGFLTDFASIPRLLWNILPPTGKYGKAAVVHDYLYVVGGVLPDGRVFTKADADKIFYDAMLVLGVGQPKRWLMYQAVQHFGVGNFKKIQCPTPSHS